MKRWLVAGLIVALGFGGVGAGYYYAHDGSDDDAAADLSLVSSSSNSNSSGSGTADAKKRGALRAVGLTSGQRLVRFDVDKPGQVRTIGKVTGLTGDTRLVGIDYRVQDGKLYGVGDAGGVYTLAGKAKATKVSQLTVALAGNAFGVDFNPAADRLRVVSDTGQNLRHNVNDGGTTTADTTLSYPPATTAAAGITAAAYTNNDLNPDTATALYDIDTMLDQVALQAPANSGQLSPIGKLGLDAASDAGFDIYARIRDGRAIDATGYATLSVGDRAALYRISLITGRAEKVGAFPGKARVIDLALPLNQ